MKINKTLIIVFLLAFLVRLIALNQSLWLDESVTAHVVKSLSFVDIVRKFSPNDFHPPLYYLFMKLWTNIFGYSEISLRMPSILFSLATGYFVYLIGGVWASLFFLFNPLIIYYSQEARMYMMATFFLTSVLYFFISRNKNKILFGLLIALAFLTFYGSIFLITAIFIYLLYKKQYSFFIYSFLILLFSLILISSLFYTQWIHSKTALINVRNWSLVLGKTNLKNLLLIPIKFSIGRIDFYPKTVYYAIAGLWTGFVLFLAIKSKNNYFLKYLIILTLSLALLISFFVPMLDYFRYIYLIPLIAILLASPSRNSVIKYFAVFGFIIFSLIYLLLPQFHREDWKSLATSLNKYIPVYIILPSSDPLKYYRPNLKINELRTNNFTKGPNNLITVIPYTADIYGYDYKTVLRKNGFKLRNQISFRGLTVEYYTSL